MNSRPAAGCAKGILRSPAPKKRIRGDLQGKGLGVARKVGLRGTWAPAPGKAPGNKRGRRRKVAPLGHLDLDCLWSEFFTLGYPDGQHPVVELGLGLLSLRCRR